MEFGFDKININEVLAQTRLYEDEGNRFEHDDLTKRLKRTLYYNPLKRPDLDTLSFSVTKSAVTSFRDAAPMPFGKLGHRYASRVARDACISPCALLLGLIYIERLKHKNLTYLESVSSSDLFLISMMVASKYLYDEGSKDEVFNDEWAVSGDMEVEKVNKLEMAFLGAIDWNLYVNPQQFSSMLNVAETEIAFSNGKERGWLSYSDLRSLLDCNIIYKQLTQTAGILSKATCMCMIMYSGLVCLAALTSSALVSVSRMPSFEGAHSDLSTQHHSHVLRENSTTDESPMLDVEVDETVLENFPGFHSDIFSAKHVSRKRISLKHEYRFLGHRPIILTTRNPEQDNQNETADNIPITDHDPEIVPIIHKQSTEIPQITQQQRKPFCAMLEAVLFMAHVPTFFTTEDNPKKTCDSCRNHQTEVKRQDVCTRNVPLEKSRSSQNCSIYARYGIDFQTHRPLLRPTLHGKSVSGILHPTLPPLYRVPENITNFARIPLIVH